MRRYNCGYRAIPDEVRKQSQIRGKFFTVEFVANRTEGNEIDFYDVVILTRNHQNARRASQLVTASLSLLDGCTSLPLHSVPLLVPLQDDGEEIPKFHSDFGYIARGAIPKAVEIAAKSSFKRKHYISLLKYQLGCELHSNDIMDLYPDYTKLSRNPSDHLRIAYATILFYSVLEELGLEIRANQNHPSKINGKWNPLVRNELERRLTKAKIDITEETDWNLRSTPTKIERMTKPDTSTKSTWARFGIRDARIQLVDAISLVSWMRSKIASHRTSTALTSLSIYDLANANFLARRILLETLGFFE